MQQAECMRNCWITGAIAGLGVMLLVSGIGSTDWAGGLFLGALTCLMLGSLLVWLVADGQPEPYDPGLNALRPVKAAVVAKAPEFRAANLAAQDAVAGQVVAKAALKTDSSRPKKAKTQDLKQINGIGPKIEVALNDLGITRFDQIAAWTPADEDSVAAKLGRLGGRIGTDHWVAQARDLMLADGTKTGGTHG